MTAERELLTPEQAARRLGWSPRYVLRIARAGYLPRVKLGRRTVMFDPEEIERFIADRTQRGAPAQPRSQARLFESEDDGIPTRF